MSEVLYEASDRIATITLNRPDRMNAISGPMLMELSERLCGSRPRPQRPLHHPYRRGTRLLRRLDLQDASGGPASAVEVAAIGGDARPADRSADRAALDRHAGRSARSTAVRQVTAWTSHSVATSA